MKKNKIKFLIVALFVAIISVINTGNYRTNNATSTVMSLFNQANATPEDTNGLCCNNLEGTCDFWENGQIIYTCSGDWV